MYNEGRLMPPKKPISPLFRSLMYTRKNALLCLMIIMHKIISTTFYDKTWRNVYNLILMLSVNTSTVRIRTHAHAHTHTHTHTQSSAHLNVH